MRNPPAGRAGGKWEENFPVWGSSRGSVIVMLIPISLTLFALTLLVLRVGILFTLAARAQTVADMSVLSSLRLRVQALEKIPGRWESIGNLIKSANGEGAFIASGSWNPLTNETQRLTRSLPGYMGRPRAVIKVVAEANGTLRERIEAVEEEASNLGLSSQPLRIQDEMGRTEVIPDVWLKRNWSPHDLLGDPSGKTTHIVHFPALNRVSRGRIIWNVNRTDPVIVNQGNGGYPVHWFQALNGGVVTPFRFPYYHAEISE